VVGDLLNLRCFSCDLSCDLDELSGTAGIPVNVLMNSLLVKSVNLLAACVYDSLPALNCLLCFSISSRFLVKTLQRLYSSDAFAYVLLCEY
jgi:hypothetical protein